MRRVLRRQLPAFSATFGLHPWDVDRLWPGEVETYLRALGGGDGCETPKDRHSR